LEQVLQLNLLTIISGIDMKSKIKILIYTQLLFFITSCATSQQGTEQVVRFTSIPSGATVKTSHGFSCSITPCKIKLPRNKSFEATISKPGFTTESVRVNSIPSGAGAVGALGSALIGGVIATGYDVYKGGIYELNPNEVEVKMQSTTAMVLEEIRGISNMNLFSN
tara:strand:- start:132 stop:629 length:498 start_codon:yes stop_codon:yes gene_type:complete